MYIYTHRHICTYDTTHRASRLPVPTLPSMTSTTTGRAHCKRGKQDDTLSPPSTAAAMHNDCPHTLPSTTTARTHCPTCPGQRTASTKSLVANDTVASTSQSQRSRNTKSKRRARGGASERGPAIPGSSLP